MYTPSESAQRKLTSFYIGVEEQDYALQKILRPMKDVPKRGKIAVYGRSHLKVLGVPTPRRIPAPELDMRKSDTSFDLQPYRRKVVVTDEEMEDWDLPLKPIQSATGALKENASVEREYLLAQWMLNSSNFTNTGTPSTKWNASGGGTAARNDFDTMIAAIGSETGIEGFLSVDNWRALRRAWQTELIPAGVVDPLGLDAMARLIGIDAFHILSAEYDTSTDPDNPVMARIWGDGHCWLARTAQDGKASRRCFGVSADRNTKITTPRTDDPDGVKVIIKQQFANVIIDETKAYFMDTCLS